MLLALAFMIMVNRLCPYPSLWLQAAQHLVTFSVNLTSTCICIHDFYQRVSVVTANMLLIPSKPGSVRFLSRKSSVIAGTVWLCNVIINNYWGKGETFRLRHFSFPQMNSMTKTQSCFSYLAKTSNEQVL